MLGSDTLRGGSLCVASDESVARVATARGVLRLGGGGGFVGLGAAASESVRIMQPVARREERYFFEVAGRFASPRSERPRLADKHVNLEIQ